MKRQDSKTEESTQEHHEKIECKNDNNNFDENTNDNENICKSIFIFLFAFVTISLGSGLLYGWPALRHSLILEEENDESSTSTSNRLRENDFALIFTIGTCSSLGCSFIVGIVRDKLLGSRITALFCMLAVSVGVFGIAFCDRRNAFGLSICALLLGIGSGTQLCLLSLASLFPEKYEGMVLSSLNGAYQISSLVFLILTSISKSRKISFGCFSVVLLLISILSMKILPNEAVSSSKINSNKNDNKGREVENLNEEAYGELTKSSTKLRIENNNDDGQLSMMIGNGKEVIKEEKNGAFKQHPKKKNDEETMIEQVRSLEYVLLVLWLSMQLIPSQYYIATIGFQMEKKGDTTGRYTSLFLIIYVFSAALTPILGKIVDHFGLATGHTMTAILSSLSLFILSAISSVGNGNSSESLNMYIVIGMSFCALGRMNVFTMFYVNVVKRFGYLHYGTLIGIGLSLASVLSLMQYPLITIATNGSQNKVNILCGFALLFQGIPYSIWLGRREKSTRHIKTNRVVESCPGQLRLDTDAMDKTDIILSIEF